MDKIEFNKIIPLNLYFVKFVANNVNVFKVGISYNLDDRFLNMKNEYKTENITLINSFVIYNYQVEKQIINYLTNKYPKLKYKLKIGSTVKTECFYYDDVFLKEIDEIKTHILQIDITNINTNLEKENMMIKNKLATLEPEYNKTEKLLKCVESKLKTLRSAIMKYFSARLSKLNKESPDYLGDFIYIVREFGNMDAPMMEHFKDWQVDEAIRALQKIDNKNLSNIDLSNNTCSLDNLTKCLKTHNVVGNQYAIITNIIHEECFDITIKAHKTLKRLKDNQNLRDNMVSLELEYLEQAEFFTIQVIEYTNITSFEDIKNAAIKGARYVKKMRIQLENDLNIKVVTSRNMIQCAA